MCNETAQSKLQRDLPIVWVEGVAIHAITEVACIEIILSELDLGRGGWVITHNLDHLRRRVHDPSFAAICAEATLVVADGMPLIWASRLQDTPIPERVAGSNLTVSLSAKAAARDRSIFLLGGSPGTARAAAAVLRARHPAIRIAGTYCPPIGFENDADEVRRLGATVIDASPDIVYVALGSPKQERLIHALRSDLPGAWWLGVGISLSFVSGHIKRAPLWMQRSGLEWVHRLAQEPHRLGRRYLMDGIPFAVQLLTGSAWHRMRGTVQSRSGQGTVSGQKTEGMAPRKEPGATQR